MPYINKYERDEYFLPTPATSGRLNYCITKICHQYLIDQGISYTNINEIIGVLECAKLEFYRQIAVPYEDIKKQENGAISSLDG